ncbi:MAG: hypothetical protein JXR20_10760 [Balneola sp.]
MNRSLSIYFKWILSFIFISAGILKIFSPENTGDILIFLFEVEYNTSLAIVYSIAAIEILLGASLFFGIKEKLTKMLIFFTCSLFLFVAILGYTNGWEFACGCFGRFSFGRFDVSMVFRNALLLSMSIWIIFGESIAKNMNPKGLITNN